MISVWHKAFLTHALHKCMYIHEPMSENIFSGNVNMDYRIAMNNLIRQLIMAAKTSLPVFRHYIMIPNCDLEVLFCVIMHSIRHVVWRAYSLHYVYALDVTEHKI